MLNDNPTQQSVTSFVTPEAQRRILLAAPTPHVKDFRLLAKRAQAIGATHVLVSDLPKSRWQWEADMADPYPNWGMLRPSIFKVAVPEELKPWVPSDYAARNMEILHERGEILREFGLKAVFVGIDPSFLPEAAFRVHPEWRGARCEHPRRARKPYFSVNIDHPQVLDMYQRAVAEICRTVPIESFDILTNDSGGGVPWSANLYHGANGPSNSRQRRMPERVVAFLSAIQAGAREAGLDPVVSLQFGYDDGRDITRDVVDAITLELLPGQIVGGRTREGRIRTILVGEDLLYNLVNPAVGIPLTLRCTSQLAALREAPEANLYIRLPLGEPQWTFDVLGDFIRHGHNGPVSTLQSLARHGEARLGIADTDSFIELHQSIATALSHLQCVGVEPLLLLGGINQRWFTRPLVPFPQELTPEEADFWRKFQFQATSAEEADDILNQQGFTPFEGFGGVFLGTLALNKVEAELENAENLAAKLIPQATANGPAELDLLVTRLRAYRHMLRSARNAIRYQGILDLTDFETPPPQRTIWPLEGDERLRHLNNISRDEIDNCYEFANLIDQHGEQVVQKAGGDVQEDIFILPENLAGQLRRKAEITLDHLNDAYRLYERRQGA